MLVEYRGAGVALACFLLVIAARVIASRSLHCWKSVRGIAVGRAQKSPVSVAVAGEQTRILRAATSRANDRISIQQERNCHYVRQ
jgi:hypothetical protein